MKNKNRLIISLIILLFVIPLIFSYSEPQFNPQVEPSNIEVDTQITEEKATDKQPDNLISDPSLDNPIENQIINDNIQELNQEEIPPIITICGNGRLEIGELCDDGNLINGDGCSSICTIEEEKECPEEEQIDHCSKLEWHKIDMGKLGDNNQQRGHSIEVDSKGNVYAVTTEFGATIPPTYLVQQFNTCGRLIWQNEIITTNLELNNADYIDIDKYGNSYVIGTEGSTKEGIFINKYDFYGNLVWNRNYNNPRGFEYGEGIGVDSKGNVYAVGFTKSNEETSFDILILKYNSNGDLLWRQIFNSDFNLDDFPAAVDVDEEGNAYVFGSIEINPNKKKYWLGKYSPDGYLIWSVDGRKENTNSEGKGIKIGPDENVYLTILDYANKKEKKGIDIIKYSPNGKLIKTFSYYDNLYDYSPAGIDVNNDNIFLAGKAIPSPKYKLIDQNLWAGKFDSVFYPVYNEVIDGTANSLKTSNYEKFMDVSVDSEGNAYYIGTIVNKNNNGLESQDMIIKKEIPS